MARNSIAADLIADIYEAAISDERWPDLAQIVSSAAGITGTALWIVENGQILDMSVTLDLLATQEPYLAHYAKLDPWQRGLFGQPSERVRLSVETFPERELHKTEFYNDFARPNEIHRPMGAMMRLGNGAYATVASNRPIDKKIFDESDPPRLQRLLPHVRRALQLRISQRKLALRAPMHVAVLDALAFGVIICDAERRIAVINKAAETIARTSAGLNLRGHGKGIETRVASETHTLAALVHDAANGGPGGVLRITGRSGGFELIALVTPLPSGFGQIPKPDGGYAMVTLRSAMDDPSFSAQMLTELFSLSPAQAEIAQAIYNGKSPEDIAAARGIAISTLRTHLAEIFLRTGADSQRDLIRLLGMLPPVRMQKERAP